MNTKARPETKRRTKGHAHAQLYGPADRESPRGGARPALEAKGGSAHTFAEWTLAGHGIVLVLSTGQEFWLTLAEASF